MSGTWMMGRGADGQNWLAFQNGKGEASLPMIFWRDGEPPERYKYLAKQSADMAEMDAELAKRYARQQEIHLRQAEAFTAIAEVLETGTATTVTIEPLEPAILPQKPEGA